MKTLLAITTYNQIEYTKKLVNCLQGISIPNLDIIFIDDVSKDGTQKFLKESKLNLIERKTPKGLTWSWNIAYRKFKTEGYDILIIANNDILFTQQSLVNLINATKGKQLVCPLSTKRGAGHNGAIQDVLKYYALGINPNDPKNYKIVQNKLNLNKCIPMNRFNGFLFSMSRKIIESQFNEQNLINPKLTNVHQEGDLQRRLKEKPFLYLKSFVFHFKGVSFPKKGLVNGKDIRQNLNIYH